jgi:hypothetical protein
MTTRKKPGHDAIAPPAEGQRGNDFSQTPPAPGSPAHKVAIALTALLFLVMGLRYFAPPPAASLEGLSRELASSPQAGPDTPLTGAWGTVQNPVPAEQLSPVARDCRIGSLAVRFHLANEIGNREAALQQAVRLEGLLSSGGYPKTLRQPYARQAESLRKPSRPPDPKASRLALELLDEYLQPRPAYALGRWAEMARQAARFGFVEYFEGLAVPEEVLIHTWSADLQTTLETLDADLRADPNPDLPRLEERLTDLLAWVAQ